MSLKPAYVGALLFVIVCALANAEAPPSSPAEVTGRAGTFLSSLKSFQADIDTTETLIASDGKHTTPTKTRIWMRRPKMMLMVHQSPTGATITYCDGTTVSTYRPVFRAFHAAPQTSESIQSFVEQNLGKIGASLFALDPAASINAFSPVLGKPKRFATVDIDSLLFPSFLGSELLIARSERALPVYLRERQPTTAPGAIHHAESLITWNTELDIDPVTFKFSPPPGTLQVEQLSELMGSDIPPLRKGMPAPQFKLSLTGGGEVDLKALRGKIVVLDFFITKCIGCHDIMTTLSDISKTYASRGVQVYPVNVKESREKVETFFGENQFDLKVALDTDGSITSAYRVQKVPETFIIAPNGTIHYVHLGLTPDYRESLLHQLDSLTSGTQPQ